MDNGLPQERTAKGQGKILILEDSKPQAQRLVGILREGGYSVIAAGDGVEGLDALTGSRPDLIISDIWMPRLDGYGFCNALKKDRELAHIPVILLTSLSEPKDIVEGLNCRRRLLPYKALQQEPAPLHGRLHHCRSGLIEGKERGSDL